MLKKVCRKCKEEKPVSEFGKNKRASDKLTYECKACDKQRQDKQRGVEVKSQRMPFDWVY